MKLYLAKKNTLYDFLEDLPLEQIQKATKKRLSNRIEEIYQFFFKGSQISMKKVQELMEKNLESEQWIIVHEKPQKQKLIQKVSYESHRQIIEKYLKETKTNNKQKIKQNAEFIFQNAIDGNFKYHSFDYFQLQKQFTQERKAQLLDEVFWKLCESKDDELKLADRKKNNLQKKQSQTQRKEQQSLKNLDSSIQLPQKQKTSEKQSQQILQLHQLQYINQNWKQLLCVNKYLLKTNLDNLKYYAQLPKQQYLPQKHHQNHQDQKMQVENFGGKSERKIFQNDEQIEI